MVPRRKIWPPDRPPIPVRPEHFQSVEEVRDYLDQPKLPCLMCGKRFRKLGPHVTRTHRVTVEEYNERFGLPLKTGLVGTSALEKLRRNAEASDFPERGRAALRIYRQTPGKRRNVTSTAFLMRQREIALTRPRIGQRWTKS